MTTKSKIDGDTLRRLWPELTVNQITSKFGVSKNAVLGKAHRMGLPSRSSMTGKKLRERIEPAPQYRPGTGEDGCRYPLWADGKAPTHQYCGAPQREGSPYCPHHHKRCYTGTKSKSKWVNRPRGHIAAGLR